MVAKNPDLERVHAFRETFSGHSLAEMGAQAQDLGSEIQITTPFPVAVLEDNAVFQALKNELSTPVKLVSKVPRFAIKAGIQSHPKAKNVICVASGKGGVGKSTVAVNLARALKSLGAKVGILDADIYGPSVPKMVGHSDQKAQVEQKHLIPIMCDEIPTISIGYLIDEETPMVWRGPMISSALSQLLNETAWPELDYLLVDCPPGTGDIQLTLGQKMPITGAVIVTTPQQVANIDALKALKMFEKVEVPVLGVVENMSYFHCQSCDAKNPLLGVGGGRALAEKGKTSFLGSLAFNHQIAQNMDQGRSALDIEPEYAEIAKRLAESLSIRPRDYSLGIKKQIIS